MLPQPPPDAPAPPPSEDALRSQQKWTALWIVGAIAIAGCIILLTRPVVIRGGRKPDHTEATSNARQIGLALFEFETEYGKFPDVSTTSPLRKKTGTLLPLGAKTSNDFFRQLIASGITDNEGMFFAKVAGVRKGDDRIEGAHALEKGECGFSYLVGLSSEGNPSRPLLVAPLIPGTDRFDPKPFQGRAVILMMDNSVTSMPIEKDGHVMAHGKNLLDPTNPVWGSKDKWVIAWPEL